MRSRLILNPVSGTDSGPDYLPLINQTLRERVGDMDIVITVAEGDATRSAAQAARDGYDAVFVAGGDGTLNEVLNGIASVPGALARMILGVIPLGTGNDFATTLGFDEDVEKAIAALAEGVLRPVDVGILNDRFFINVSGGGFIAEVSDAVDTQLKSVAGRLAYLIGGAQVLLTHSLVRAAVRGWGPGAEHDLDLELHAFAVCNSPQIGGGRMIAPDARIDDGLLDVCLIEAMPTIEFLALLRKVSDGEHLDDPRVHYFRVSDIDFQFDRTVKVNTDGQVIDARRCTYQVVPRATRVLAPPPAAGPLF